MSKIDPAQRLRETWATDARARRAPSSPVPSPEEEVQEGGGGGAAPRAREAQAGAPAAEFPIREIPTQDDTGRASLVERTREQAPARIRAALEGLAKLPDEATREALRLMIHGSVSELGPLEGVVAVSGSRYMQGAEGERIVAAAMTHLPVSPTQLLDGACPAGGADQLAHDWATRVGVSTLRRPADWKRYGDGAGPRRNRTLIKSANAMVLFWDGRRKKCGTWDVLRELQRSPEWIVWKFVRWGEEPAVDVVFAVRWSLLGVEVEG